MSFLRDLYERIFYPYRFRLHRLLRKRNELTQSIATLRSENDALRLKLRCWGCDPRGTVVVGCSIHDPQKTQPGGLSE